MATERSESATGAVAPQSSPPKKRVIRRKRTTKKTASKEPAPAAQTETKAEAPKAEPPAPAPAATTADAPASKPAAKRTRRGKRGGAKHKKATQSPAAPAGSSATAVADPPPAPVSPAPLPEPQVVAESPKALPTGKERIPFGAGLNVDDSPAPATDPPPAEGVKKAKRSRRGGARVQKARRRKAAQLEAAAAAATGADGVPAESAAVDEMPSELAQEELPAEPQELQSAEADGTATRLVLKPRPPRRARGGRGRRKHGKAAGEGSAHADAAEASEDSELIEDEQDAVEVAEEASPETTPSAKPKRSRRKKAKKAEAPVEALEDDVDAPPVQREVIDARTPDYKPKGVGREMIINITAGAECRIAILQEGRLEELYIERRSAVSHVGNIYVGRITNVEPSIQAAFVDFGLGRNGFLHISDVQPQYFPNGKNEREQVGKKVPRRDRPPIQKCFRRGDKVIVQVIKEGVGTKGPTLTSYLSIPGRFVVMMPGMDKLGVSRKIEDDAARRAMREVLSQLTMPDGMGFILRTAGLDRPKRELQSDLNYLARLWKTVEKRIEEQSPPCELYQESDLVIRTIRDVYATDFERIVVDDPTAAEKAREFLRIAMPRTPGNVVEYDRPEPIFHYFDIEEAIRRIHSRYVPLPSGGSIVIDSTEAMVAIDVNSGKFRELKDAEETAFRINTEAAEEIARQLRLRDLGGLVVCDFIDMRMDRHKRAVEKALRDALKKHKERARILRMSKFGLIEMTRQRQRQSIKRSIFVDCPHCSGSGLIKTPESMSLEVMRILQLLTHRKDVHRIEIVVATEVAELILNAHRAHLHDMEINSGKRIVIKPDPAFAHDQVTCNCTDDRGMPLRIEV